MEGPVPEGGCTEKQAGGRRLGEGADTWGERTPPHTAPNLRRHSLLWQPLASPLVLAHGGCLCKGRGRGDVGIPEPVHRHRGGVTIGVGA